MDEAVGQFMGVTGVSEHVARGYLEISNGDPEQAIMLFFENPELQASFAAPPAAAAGGSASTRRSRPPQQQRTGREDASGVIHIDSDDDGDIPMSDDDGGLDDDDDDGGVAAVARNAQEEEDAAMARRLQEELYGSQGQGAPAEDGVRAPIARTTETLMGPGPAWAPSDDHDEEILQEMRARQRAARRNQNSSNPFHQTPSVWDDPFAPPVPQASRPAPAGAGAGAGAGPGAGPGAGARAAMLADLFRPPYDLMSHGSWDDARDEGKDERKWIMVNLQKLNIFQCQALNRDLWKHEGVRNLIKEHFIFLQYETTDPMAQDYITFYCPNQSHENDDNFPHVSIIDPRTGEQVKVWSGEPFPSATEFYGDLVEFLDRYSLAANSKNPVQKSKPKQTQVDLGRLTEEEMLELAMQNSLENNGAASATNVQDPDSLTKSQHDIGKGKGKETEASASESAFAQISSTNPHVEPEHNPATTTRIQFRHSEGRVVRRFAVTDPVRRMFEWLKAEPFEGKDGVPFELKAMPAGRDLIDELDKTIEEAGLKQGTVMIEFIEA
ncbi:hypothetical protein GGR56DRAFT_619832 [Xylariaceae sp. FL0804]|nr:hypothetical protein GGR56DRAFT_619832 [Xylariaceae sp. FL0804]